MSGNSSFLNKPGKNIAIASLIVGVICAVSSFVLPALLNTGTGWFDAGGSAAPDIFSTEILAVLWLISMAGVVLGVAALLKAFYKPGLYGGKAIAFPVLIINGLIALTHFQYVLFFLFFLAAGD